MNFQDMELCDVHLHITTPHSVVPDEEFQMPACENAHHIISIMDKCGIQKANIPAVSICAPINLVSNPLSLYAKTLSPGRVFAMASLVYGYCEQESIHVVEQAKSLIKCGFDGFKFLLKPNVRKTNKIAINNPMFDGFFQLAQDKQYPILLHTGDPASFWKRDEVPWWALKNGWYYGDEKDIPSLEEMYNEIFEVLERYPYLNITFAHFLFMSSDYERAEQLLDRYANIMLDVTPGIEMYADFAKFPDDTRGFFTRYSDRVLFGTDNTGVNGTLTERNLEQSKNRIEFMRTFFETEEEVDIEGNKARGIALPGDVCENLYNRNFHGFLGRSAPTAVDTARALNLCRAYREFTPVNYMYYKYTIDLLNELESEFQSLPLH